MFFLLCLIGGILEWHDLKDVSESFTQGAFRVLVKAKSVCARWPGLVTKSIDAEAK